MRTIEIGQSFDVCDVCKRRSLVRRLARDHDHANDEWRGKLCQACNVGLGFFKEDPKRLRRAAEYVEFWKMKHAGDADFETLSDYSPTGDLPARN
jgi:recombination endonuclease VII